MAQLELLTGAKQGARLAIEGNRIVLGRDATCDIVINESMIRRRASGADAVSRKHAIIYCVDGQYFIEDGDGKGTRSRNRTFVNDEEVPFPGRTPLRNNDRIRICDFRCVFRDEPEVPITVEASIDHESSVQSLQAQPAEKLQAIIEISNSLGNTLDVDALLPRIVDNLLRLFKQADRGFIILRDEEADQLVVRVFKTQRPNEDADSRFSTTIVRSCLSELKAILGNDLQEQFPDNQSISNLPIRSLMCAPLWSRDRQPLGAIQIDTRGNRKFTQEDLNLLLAVASQASIALSNARFHRDSLVLHERERDLEVAHHVQHCLLPQKLPVLPGYDFFAAYEPAQKIGGDYYDFIPMPQDRLAILLGDVAGKGVAGALVMVKFSVEARHCLRSAADLAQAVGTLNTLIYQAAISDRFVTLAAVVLDPRAHTATLVNAGHPSPLLFRHATGAVDPAIPLEVAGPPLGIGDGEVYGSHQVELAPGDGLLLFSDGVLDAMSPQEKAFRLSGVRTVLSGGDFSPRGAGQRLIEAVERHAAGCPQNDDITLVCFGRARA
jgi:sigma-B regulation protein RsbU (phosphoserine phosphatase)